MAFAILLLFSSLSPLFFFWVCTWSNTRGHIVRDISHHFFLLFFFISIIFSSTFFFLHEKKNYFFSPSIPITVFLICSVTRKGGLVRDKDFFQGQDLVAFLGWNENKNFKGWKKYRGTVGFLFFFLYIG